MQDNGILMFRLYCSKRGSGAVDDLNNESGPRQAASKGGTMSASTWAGWNVIACQRSVYLVSSHSFNWGQSILLIRDSIRQFYKVSYRPLFFSPFFRKKRGKSHMLYYSRVNYLLQHRGWLWHQPAEGNALWDALQSFRFSLLSYFYFPWSVIYSGRWSVDSTRWHVQRPSRGGFERLLLRSIVTPTATSCSFTPSPMASRPMSLSTFPILRSLCPPWNPSAASCVILSSSFKHSSLSNHARYDGKRQFCLSVKMVWRTGSFDLACSVIALRNRFP